MLDTTVASANNGSSQTGRMPRIKKLCYIALSLNSFGGDVNPNPGPVKYLYAEYQKPVKSNQKALQVLK